jgi:hypothetical protein
MGKIESVRMRGKGNEMEEPGDRIVRIAVANETLRLTCSGTLYGDVEMPIRRKIITAAKSGDTM